MHGVEKCGSLLLVQADAFISLHGSGEMNSMFMRRDSIKIQMRQKDFGTVHRHAWGGSIWYDRIY